jgi:hypothetical protein
MTKEEQDLFDSGYWESRSVILSRLEKILTASPDDHSTLLEDLIEELRATEREEAWENAQKIEPELTREEYETLMATPLDPG